MAGDWVKWVKGLTKKPEVIRLSGLLSLSRGEVASRLMTFWEWCDDEIPDDAIQENGSAFVTLSPHDGDNMAAVDDIVGTPNFAKSLAAVKWIHFRDGRIELPNFGRHNGETAKTRARNARNQKKKRDKSSGNLSITPEADVTKMSPQNGDKTVTREEKRREDIHPQENTPSDVGRKRFVKPTIEQVAEYCRSRGNAVNPQKWMDYYTSNGWMVGRNKMSDWKAAVRTWEGNSNGIGTANAYGNARSNPPAVEHNRVRHQSLLDQVERERQRGPSAQGSAGGGEGEMRSSGPGDGQAGF